MGSNGSFKRKNRLYVLKYKLGQNIIKVPKESLKMKTTLSCYRKYRLKLNVKNIIEKHRLMAFHVDFNVTFLIRYQNKNIWKSEETFLIINFDFHQKATQMSIFSIWTLTRQSRLVRLEWNGTSSVNNRDSFVEPKYKHVLVRKTYAWLETKANWTKAWQQSGINRKEHDTQLSNAVNSFYSPFKSQNRGVNKIVIFFFSFLKRDQFDFPKWCIWAS